MRSCFSALTLALCTCSFDLADHYLPIGLAVAGLAACAVAVTRSSSPTKSSSDSSSQKPVSHAVSTSPEHSVSGFSKGLLISGGMVAGLALGGVAMGIYHRKNLHQMHEYAKEISQLRDVNSGYSERIKQLELGANEYTGGWLDRMGANRLKSFCLSLRPFGPLFSTVGLLAAFAGSNVASSRVENREQKARNVTLFSLFLNSFSFLHVLPTLPRDANACYSAFCVGLSSFYNLRALFIIYLPLT